MNKISVPIGTDITKPYRQGLRLDTFSSGRREPFCLKGKLQAPFLCASIQRGAVALYARLRGIHQDFRY